MTNGQYKLLIKKLRWPSQSGIPYMKQMKTGFTQGLHNLEIFLFNYLIINRLKNTWVYKKHQLFYQTIRRFSNDVTCLYKKIGRLLDKT
jgi:hypothetical protein